MPLEYVLFAICAVLVSIFATLFLVYKLRISQSSRKYIGDYVPDDFCPAIDKIYKGFILKNGCALAELAEINKKYKFRSYRNYFGDCINTYDNANVFETVSCQDFLIYQLQSLQYDVQKDINLSYNNAKDYKLYSQEIAAVKTLGTFKKDSPLLDKERLLCLEKALFYANILPPPSKFTLNVTLLCTKMNGQIIAEKDQDFTAEEISSLIKRLNNKYGNFFNDREIWDALCRVERGKVTNKLRFAIYARDGCRCRICGAKNDLEIDHIVPISKGGKSTPDNLQTLCKSCNKAKGDFYYK